MSITSHNPTETAVDRRRLNIELLYIDLSVCMRCQQTDAGLEEALADTAHVLRATGVDVAVQKNPRAIRGAGPSTGICQLADDPHQRPGYPVRWNDQGKPLRIVRRGVRGGRNRLPRVELPGEGIHGGAQSDDRRGVLRAVYGDTQASADKAPPSREPSENLKWFFAAKRKKEAGPGHGGPASSKEGAECCAPARSAPFT